MDKLRVGIAGRRGISNAVGLRAHPRTEIAAMCDIDEARLHQDADEHGIEKRFTRFEEMLDHVDAVVVSTPMQLHAAQTILALQAGKHVLSEVTAAVTLDECWRILDAARASDKVYMLAENYCYFEENVLVREMARKGMFGDLYFGEGEYVHDVRFLHHDDAGNPTWRYYWQVGTNGNTYCTHELGPVMQWFTAADPNERIETVTCLGSGVHTDPEHPHDDTSLTLLKLRSGKLIKLRLDMMSNHPGMVFYSLQGVNGVYESGRGGGCSSRIWVGENRSVSWSDPHRQWRPVSDFHEHYPPEWKAHMDAARAAGHGGGDYHTARLFATSVVDGTPPDIDVYQALEWTAAGLCSQISAANGGVPIRVPDFRDPRQRPITLDAPPANP